MTLKIADLQKNEFHMQMVPLCSTLSQIFAMNVNSYINIRQSMEGFLNVGAETGGFITWNRMWCSLRGSELKYFNYPDEIETGIPLGMVDLRTSASGMIKKANRSMCPKPRTLLLETVNLQADVIADADEVPVVIRYFLSADTAIEMRSWEDALNSILLSLTKWKCMEYIRIGQ